MDTPRLTSITDVLTMDECATYLGVTGKTLSKFINDPETPLPHHRLGPSDRYPVKFLRHRVDDWRIEHGRRFRLRVPRQGPKPTPAESKLEVVYRGTPSEHAEA